MTTQEIKNTVLCLLSGIAPEADLANIKADVAFRDQLDLDSMDILNFVIAMHKEFKVEIPEADYAKLATLNGCAAYLESHMASVAK